jgi:hypothetical protein
MLVSVDGEFYMQRRLVEKWMGGAIWNATHSGRVVQSHSQEPSSISLVRFWHDAVVRFCRREICSSCPEDLYIGSV